MDTLVIWCKRLARFDVHHGRSSQRKAMASTAAESSFVVGSGMELSVRAHPVLQFLLHVSLFDS